LNCEVPIELRETAAVARVGEALRLGVPLPRGCVRDGAAARVVHGDGPGDVVQWRALSRWSDGSVKWALADFAVDLAAGARRELVLRWEPGGPAAIPPASPRVAVAVQAHPGGFRVDTGAAVFDVPGPGGADGALLLGAVTLGGRAMLAPEGLRWRLRPGVGAGVAEAHVQIDAVDVEDAGPVRATLAVRGHATGAGLPVPLPFRARLAFIAGSAEACIEFRLRNPRAAVHAGGLWDLGDPASILVRDLSLRVCPAESPTSLAWSPMPADAPVERTACEWRLHQDSSGGEHWDSPNHLAADGTPSVSFRGYRVIEGADATAAPVAVGDRATPRLRLAGPSGWVAAFVEDFWQNFPKALRCAGGALEVALFPGEGRLPVELQGGEQKRHVAWIAFGSHGEEDRLARHASPVEAWTDPAWIEATGAIVHFTAPAPGDDPRLEQYVGTLVDGPQSVAVGRERIDEYGWRHYGDAWADHEAVRDAGPQPFVSHYNNQYDLVYSAGLQALRTRDPRWLELMRTGARHVVDVDVYHAGDDKAAFNGGMFWHTDHYRPAGLATHRTYSRCNATGGPYGGGPSNEHCYSSGLLLHHLLTGDPDAAEAVAGLADWVIAMDDGGRNLFGLLDPGPTGAASQTASPDYHGPGRGAGNAVRALLDAYALTRARRYLAKAEELLQRCVHPRDDVAARGFDEPELRWSYLVFLQVLARYLDLKRELGEPDYGFHHARESLLGHAAWMLVHEVPYRDVLHKVAIPSETWPAHDARKAEVLFEAARWSDDAASCEALRRRAAFFAARGLDDVLSFETAYLLRPRVIVAGQATALRRFSRVPPEPAASLPHAHEFGAPGAFVPQRARLAGTLRERLRAAGAELRRELRARRPRWRP
jgi:hypothetical protein